MYTPLQNEYEPDPTFSGDLLDTSVRKCLPPIRTKHLPPHVQAIVPQLVITAKDYDRCINGRNAIDCEGLIERIVRRQRRPPTADIELYDLRDILVRQDDYETIACRVEGRLRLLECMERRAA